MAPGMLLASHAAPPANTAAYAAPFLYKRAGTRGLRTSGQMNSHGDFNGTCTREEAMSITPETPSGSCSSYFADVTDYCCAAVGGSYNATFRAVNVSEEQAFALNHPICVTSNYADMFSCYSYVTETHCSGTTPVPYGVCDPAGADTSRSTQHSSSVSIHHTLSKHLQIGMLLYASLMAAATIYAL